MAVVRHLEFFIFEIQFFNYRSCKETHRTKFREDGAILDFQKFEILTVSPLQMANMRHHTKFHKNRLDGCGDGDLTVLKWRTSAVLDLFSEYLDHPVPTMTTWRSLSVCKIWFESIQ